MKVICLEESAFYELQKNLIAYFEGHLDKQQDQWIPEKEAMRLLNIKSKTTLQKLRDEGKIRFSQPQKKLIVYDRNSILAYLDRHAVNVYR
jgi:hypothetical protein